MVKSMFAAVAGLRAHQSKMDVIGNNIANVNTYGYKTARATFRDVFYATNTGASEAGNTYGGTNPSQLGYGSKLGSIDSIMSSGGVATTDCSTDCMIIGNGFFLVGQMPQDNGEEEGADGEITGGIAVGTGGEDEDGEGGGKAGQVDQNAVSALQLTRVGIFSFDGAGNLVDSNGRLVYGFSASYQPVEGDDGTVGGEYTVDTSRLTTIKLPNDNTEAADADDPDAQYSPMALKEISIGSNGIITGKNDVGETVIVGQIALANVPNPNALERTDNSYYNIKANTGEITVNTAGQNSTGTIQAGALEMSNVDLSREFTDMITTQRGYQANTRIITVTDAMLEELVNMKR